MLNFISNNLQKFDNFTQIQRETKMIKSIILNLNVEWEYCCHGNYGREDVKYLNLVRLS